MIQTVMISKQTCFVFNVCLNRISRDMRRGIRAKPFRFLGTDGKAICDVIES